MKSPSIILIFLAAAAIAPIVLATSRIYSTLDQLIAASDAIAVVVIDRPNEESIIKRSKMQPFGYASAVRIQKTIKGHLSETLLIHHMSGLDDCLFQQGPGEYLVFLKRKDDKYIPCDGWPSSKPIQKGYVIGWSDSQSWSAQDSLENALKQIQQKIDGNKS